MTRDCFRCDFLVERMKSWIALVPFFLGVCHMPLGQKRNRSLYLSSTVYITCIHSCICVYVHGICTNHACTQRPKLGRWSCIHAWSLHLSKMCMNNIKATHAHEYHRNYAISFWTPETLFGSSCKNWQGMKQEELKELDSCRIEDMTVRQKDACVRRDVVFAGG